MILTAVGVISYSDDAHWLLWDVSTQHFHVASCVLVGSKDGPPHPVSPEDVISINRKSKRMDRLILQQDLVQTNDCIISKSPYIDSCFQVNSKS